MAPFVRCNSRDCNERSSWYCDQCKRWMCDKYEGVHSMLENKHKVVYPTTNEDFEKIDEHQMNETRFTAGNTTGTIKVKSETEALKTERLIVTTTSGELNHNLMHVQFRPEGNVTIEKQDVRTDGKVEFKFMAKVAGRLTAEVQVNGNHVSNSPLVVNVKPQEMRKTGSFNIKGVNIGTSEIGGIAVNRDNSRIAVSDVSSHCVHVFTTDGKLLLTYGSQGSAQGQLKNPQGLAFLNDTDLVIADCNNHRICIVNTTTETLVRNFGNQSHGDGQFYHPLGVHVDEDGNIIVCDRGYRRGQVFTIDGDYRCQFGFTPQDVLFFSDVIRHDGLFYVSDGRNRVIYVFEKRGNVLTRISTIGCVGSADGQLKGPCGLAIDNDHHLLVCDYGNNRVQKFTLDGRFVGKTWDNVIKKPRYITVLNGELLVSTGMTDDDQIPTDTTDDDQSSDDDFLNIPNAEDGRLSVRGGSDWLFVE